eukprot:m.738854 g.738854  ORF g.738854 m.738854 type:complete len:265 (+) comp23100_c0_seq5:911-1705(+)
MCCCMCSCMCVRLYVFGWGLGADMHTRWSIRQQRLGEDTATSSPPPVAPTDTATANVAVAATETHEHSTTDADVPSVPATVDPASTAEPVATKEATRRLRTKPQKPPFALYGWASDSNTQMWQNKETFNVKAPREVKPYALQTGVRLGVVSRRRCQQVVKRTMHPAPPPSLPTPRPAPPPSIPTPRSQQRRAVKAPPRTPLADQQDAALVAMVTDGCVRRTLGKKQTKPRDTRKNPPRARTESSVEVPSVCGYVVRLCVVQSVV